MSDESFPYPLMGTIHLTNRIQQFKSIPINCKVSVRISVSDQVIQHEKGLCFTAVSEVFSKDFKTLLWRNEAVMLKRGVGSKIPHVQGEILYESTIKDRDVANLEEVQQFVVPSNMGRQYAAVSGDYNPIHLTAPSAFLFGFRGGAIAHGMWTKARALASLMPDHLPDSEEGGDAVIGDAYVEYKTPLFLPSTAILSSKKTENSCVDRTSLVFEVKGAGGDQAPHLRGRCSWAAKK